MVVFSGVLKNLFLIIQFKKTVVLFKSRDALYFLNKYICIDKKDLSLSLTPNGNHQILRAFNFY
jgi:hypothetical protein